MVSSHARNEIEQTLGQVPSWMDDLAEPASDHSWGLFRDLTLGETELSPREKALVGVGVAAATKCPYCVHFHRAEAKMAGVTETELEEATTIAGTTQYFSTVLHGSEADLDDFVAETAEIVEYLEDQGAAPVDAE